MKELMNGVVNSDNGSGGGYSTSSYGINLIGKTGTAQIYENGRYLSNQYIRSFAGMFPKDNPRYVIYAALKKVYPDGNAAITSSVKEIVRKISKYFNISETSTLPSYTLSNYVSRSTEGVSKALTDLKLKPIIIGDGKYIINQSPNKGNVVLEGEKVFLLTNGNNYTMPNMNGWSRSEVLSYFSLVGIKVNINGDGYVTSQSVKKNTAINKDMEVTIELKDKY